LHLPVDSTTSESAPREELLDTPLTRDTDLHQENKEELEPPNLKLETYFIPNQTIKWSSMKFLAMAERFQKRYLAHKENESTPIK